MPGRDFVLNDEQILSLPLDVLGIEILRDLIANPESGNNTRTWLLMATTAGTFSKDALLVLNEAFEWLHNNGLIAADREKVDAHWIKITRLGREVGSSGDATRLRATARLSLDLHRSLEAKVRPQFLMGDYEMAAFAAMKAVEVRVREMGRFSNSDLGVSLMKKAFGDGGPLEDRSLDGGERSARRELFCGAIGTIKNPTSHHDVHYDDLTEASEAILLADLLMRILDRVPVAAE
jgi:uncharacterized protein (TIGR02391 family)